MVLTKLVSLCFLTSAAVIFFNVLTGRHQELANEVSSVLHQSFTRQTYEIHDPQVLEVRHEVSSSNPAECTLHARPLSSVTRIEVAASLCWHGLLQPLPDLLWLPVGTFCMMTAHCPSSADL